MQFITLQQIAKELVAGIDFEIEMKKKYIEKKYTEKKQAQVEKTSIGPQYIFVKQLSKNSNGQVILANRLIDNQPFAIKLYDTDAKEQFANEVDALQNLKHPNIVALISSNEKKLNIQGFEHSSSKSLVLEYVKGQNFFDYIQSNQNLSDEQIEKLSKQILQVFKFIHDKGFAHRDIKLENMIVNEEGSIKILDFGISSRCQMLDEFSGTTGYMAPEILKYETYDPKKADIFSIGITLFTLRMGIFPFKKASKQDMFYRTYLLGKQEMLIQAYEKLGKKKIDKNFIDLFFRMIKQNPNERPSLQEIVQICQKKQTLLYFGQSNSQRIIFGEILAK